MCPTATLKFALIREILYLFSCDILWTYLYFEAQLSSFLLRNLIDIQS